MGYLLVGNLHLSAPSPASGSTSAEGSPQKILLQDPCPDCEKGEKSDFCCMETMLLLFYRQWLYCLSLLGNEKFLRGQSQKSFQKGKQHSTAKRLIFRKFISTNTFDNWQNFTCFIVKDTISFISERAS